MIWWKIVMIVAVLIIFGCLKMAAKWSRQEEQDKTKY